MPQRDSKLILGLVDKLYDAAVNGEKWGAFLAAAADAVAADHAFVCQIDFHQRSLNYLGLAQANRQAIPVPRYGALLDDDPRRAIFDARPNQASHCRMGLSDTRLRSSRTYRTYLRPLDIEYAMVTFLPVRDGFSHDLGFTRTRARTGFTNDDCDLVNELVPHLQRAFQISRALHERPAPQQLQPQPQPRQTTVDNCKQVQIQTCLALSPAQARLAALLCDGKTVKQAAQDLQITEGSARQYLKKAFEKTGAKRQIDLIRAVERALARSN